MATARAVAPPQVRASRVGYKDPSNRAAAAPLARPARPARPSDPITEAECSDPSARSPTSSRRSTRSWTSGATAGRSPGCGRRTPADRSGASSTARSPPTTRWASTTPGAAPTRTSTSASTPCSATTSATRTGSTARACGSRSTSSATSGFTSKRDIEAFGIAEFVTLCKQRVLTYRRAPDRAVDPARDVDGLERPARAASAGRAARGRPGGDRHDRGPGRPRHRHRRDARRPARDARHGRQLLHVQQREQRPHLGLPGRVPPARLALQGPRHDAVVRPLRDRAVADGDERGLPGSRGPGPDRPVPAGRPARASRSSSGRRRRGR